MDPVVSPATGTAAARGRCFGTFGRVQIAVQARRDSSAARAGRPSGRARRCGLTNGEPGRLIAGAYLVEPTPVAYAGRFRPCHQDTVS